MQIVFQGLAAQMLPAVDYKRRASHEPRLQSPNPYSRLNSERTLSIFEVGSRRPDRWGSAAARAGLRGVGGGRNARSQRRKEALWKGSDAGRTVPPSQSRNRRHCRAWGGPDSEPSEEESRACGGVEIAGGRGDDSHVLFTTGVCFLGRSPADLIGATHSRPSYSLPGWCHDILALQSLETPRAPLRWRRTGRRLPYPLYTAGPFRILVSGQRSDREQFSVCKNRREVHVMAFFQSEEDDHRLIVGLYSH
jgi:hypothetical protein